MFVLVPLAVRSIKQESMEQQFEINNQQRSLLGNHSQMNGEFPCLTLNGTTFRTDISRSQVPICGFWRYLENHLYLEYLIGVLL